jgi:hypothetical protein
MSSCPHARFCRGYNLAFSIGADHSVWMKTVAHYGSRRNSQTLSAP